MISQNELQCEAIKRSRVFNPENYIRQYYAKLEGHQEESLSDPFYRFMENAFMKLPECSVGIQIGCGPALVLAGFSTRKIKKIWLTDYNTDCFKLIQDYIESNESDVSSWKSHFSKISELEGKNENVEQRVKRSIEGCLKIDLTIPRVFEYPFFKKVDVITSSLCIEAVATSRTNYNEIIKSLKNYLKPKGYIYLIGVLEETFYMVGDQRLPCFEITEELLRWTMEENGFYIILLEIEMACNPPTETSDFKGLFSLLAQLKQ